MVLAEKILEQASVQNKVDIQINSVMGNKRKEYLDVMPYYINVAFYYGYVMIPKELCENETELELFKEIFTRQLKQLKLPDEYEIEILKPHYQRFGDSRTLYRNYGVESYCIQLKKREKEKQK